MMDEYKNTLKNLGLQFFAEEGGSGSEETGGEDMGPEGTGEGPGKSGSNASKTFTQSDVNALLKKEKEAAKRALLKELGMEDVKTAKEGLAKYKEILKKDQTEADKAKGALGESERAKKAAEDRAILAEAKVEVLSAGCNPDYLDDVMTLALARVTEDKDIKTVVGDMKKDLKYVAFFAVNGGDSGTGGGSGYHKPNGGKDPGALGKKLGVSPKPKTNPYFN